MVIKLKRDTYKGADGSSLTDDRCKQIIDLYDFCLNHTGISYKELQNAAVKESLYAGDADGIIRTFCKLLKKLSFVNYEDDAPFEFTDMGQIFVRTHRALLGAKEAQDELLIVKLSALKQTLIKHGIGEMSKNADYNNHPIWVSIGLLHHFNTIDWKEHYYALYLLREQKCSWDEVVLKISDNRSHMVRYEFQNMKGEALANTGFSYIRALLLEAGLITNHKSESSLVSSEKEFIEQINKY